MDQIRISGLEVFAHHGVFEFEKKEGQKFVVNATLFLDLQKAGRRDDLELSVNYAAVCEDILHVMQENTYDLIEAAAEKICLTLLNKYDKIKEVEIEVKKPEAPVDAVFSDISVMMKRQRHLVYVAFGANEGDCLENIEKGIAAIEENEYCKTKKVSEIIKTTPYGVTNQNDFYNGVLEMETYLAPEELLDVLQEIEKSRGRVRKEHWGPRTLDLDILLYDNLVLESDRLILPHADMTNRDFVLAPLAEIAPHRRHPVNGKTVSELLKEVQETHIL